VPCLRRFYGTDDRRRHSHRLDPQDGGAGFSAGLKWSFVPQGEHTAFPKYLIANANANEMESVTFKDRWLMECNPHQLIEGMIIAAYAIGVSIAYIFLRADYNVAAERLQAAVDEACAAQLLGAGQWHGYVGIDVTMMVIGLGFKLSWIPLHRWTPDVYQGAPMPVTAFLATVAKAAVMAILLCFFVEAGAFQYSALMQVLTLIAMTQNPSTSTRAAGSSLSYVNRLVIGSLLLAMIALGVYPQPLIDWISVAVAVMG
jgi:NADH:ubiquinone oxidoreductase subunit 2 (subunit N)